MMKEDADLERGNYREILALIKGLDGRISETNVRITETRDDAREARDTARALIAATEAQELPERISALSAALEKVSSASRADLVNTANRITTEMRDGFQTRDVRLDQLEAFKNKLEGASGLVGWLAKNAPWLVAAILTGVAWLTAFGFKDRLP